MPPGSAACKWDEAQWESAPSPASAFEAPPPPCPAFRDCFPLGPGASHTYLCLWPLTLGGGVCVCQVVEDMEKDCAICGQGDVGHANAIVFCEYCDVAVHQV